MHSGNKHHNIHYLPEHTPGQTEVITTYTLHAQKKKEINKTITN